MTHTCVDNTWGYGGTSTHRPHSSWGHMKMGLCAFGTFARQPLSPRTRFDSPLERKPLRDNMMGSGQRGRQQTVACTCAAPLGLRHTLLTGQDPQVLGDAVFALSAVQNKGLTVRALALAPCASCLLPRVRGSLTPGIPLHTSTTLGGAHHPTHAPTHAPTHQRHTIGRHVDVCSCLKCQSYACACCLHTSSTEGVWVLLMCAAFQSSLAAFLTSL